MPADLSLYLHIPFCDTKCAYCDFNSYAGLESLIPSYTRALCREAMLWAPAARDCLVRTVFFGGGTPSLLPLEEMARILETVHGSYRFDESLELSLEANPGTVGEEYLRGLQAIGFNRLSLGVQSFDDAELRALDRIHSAAEAEAAFASARAAGFENVNLDLIFGLAGQTLAGWRRNVERALALRPEHLSLYALTIEEGTALAYRIEQGLAPEPDADLQADMYELAQGLLSETGYEQYEISNWSLPGFSCKHNLTYWRNGQWLGLGAGAHSSFGGYRFSDALSPRGYIHRLMRGSGVGGRGSRGLGPGQSIGEVLAAMVQIASWEQIDAATAMADTAILGLRLNEGISLQGIAERHGRDLFEVRGEALRECREAGLVEIDGDRLRLSDHGRFLANEVFVRLLPGQD